MPNHRTETAPSRDVIRFINDAIDDHLLYRETLEKCVDLFDETLTAAQLHSLEPDHDMSGQEWTELSKEVGDLLCAVLPTDTARDLMDRLDDAVTRWYLASGKIHLLIGLIIGMRWAGFDRAKTLAEVDFLTRKL